MNEILVVVGLYVIVIPIIYGLRLLLDKSRCSEARTMMSLTDIAMLGTFVGFGMMVIGLIGMLRAKKEAR